MEPLKPKRTKGNGPEAIIERAICTKLRILDWFCHSTHGNEFSMGLPDVYAAHVRNGTRWIEVKVEDHYSFTNAQRIVFPQMAAAGVGIWILVNDSDYEIRKLFGPPNWWSYFK